MCNMCTGSYTPSADFKTLFLIWLHVTGGLLHMFISQVTGTKNAMLLL